MPEKDFAPSPEYKCQPYLVFLATSLLIACISVPSYSLKLEQSNIVEATENGRWWWWWSGYFLSYLFAMIIKATNERRIACYC